MVFFLFRAVFHCIQERIRDHLSSLVHGNAAILLYILMKPVLKLIFMKRNRRICKMPLLNVSVFGKCILIFIYWEIKWNAIFLYNEQIILTLIFSLCSLMKWWFCFYLLGCISLRSPYTIEKLYMHKGEKFVCRLIAEEKRWLVAFQEDKLFHLFAFFVQTQTKLREELERKFFAEPIVWDLLITYC